MLYFEQEVYLNFLNSFVYKALKVKNNYIRSVMGKDFSLNFLNGKNF